LTCSRINLAGVLFPDQKNHNNTFFNFLIFSFLFSSLFFSSLLFSSLLSSLFLSLPSHLFSFPFYFSLTSLLLPVHFIPFLSSPYFSSFLPILLFFPSFFKPDYRKGLFLRNLPGLKSLNFFNGTPILKNELIFSVFVFLKNFSGVD
jgi:hypothetical protein